MTTPTKIRGQLVNQSDLAAVFGVHRTTITAWLKRGLPYVNKADPRRRVEWGFDTAEVARWLADQAVSDAVGDTDQVAEDELKRRKLAAETTLAEIEAAKKRGEVVLIDDVVRVVTDDVLACKARLRTIPQRVVARLVGEDDERRIKDILLEEIDDALSELENRFTDSEQEPEESAE